MIHDELDRLIGQLFIFGFHGLEVDETISEFYNRYPVGGMILFGRNLKNRDQVKRLTKGLQDLAGPSSKNGQLLIAVDQEGGSLSPLRGLVTSLPGNMGLAATGDPSAAYYAGMTTGKELAELGFNLNFAPVLDLALEQNPVVGTRSFSDCVETVTTFSREYASGLIAGGVLFTAKHFPGHGSCTEDSHVTLPSCREPVVSLETRDMIPFKSIIKLSGASVMMAHVKYEHLDPSHPASLSPVVVECLRKRLGFEGVIITDCLEMKAIQKFIPYPGDAVKAIEAGVDLVLISHTPEHQAASFKAVKEAVLNGKISIKRIEDSVARIDRWKKLIAKKTLPNGPKTDWTPERLAEKAITLVDPDQSWGFNNEPLTLITPELSQVTQAENFGEINVLAEALIRSGVPCQQLNCGSNPGEAEISRIIATQNRSNNRKVVFLLSNPESSSGQVRLINFLTETNRLILVCTRNPKEVLKVGADLPVVFTYSTEASVLAALARVLAGKAAPGGKLPISWSRYAGKEGQFSWKA